MRAHEKKKIDRLAIKKQVRAGRTNQADGVWTAAPTAGSMPRDLRAGHRTGRK